MKQRIFTAALIFLASVFILSVFSPALAQEKNLMPATIDGEKRPCLDCHRSPNIHTDAGAFACQGLCMECHGKPECIRQVDKTKVSLQVKIETIEKGRHRYVACIRCHRDVADLRMFLKQGRSVPSAIRFTAKEGPLEARI